MRRGLDPARTESVNDTSRASSGSKSTADAPTWASSCGLLNACSPSTPASGTTGSSMPRTSALWSRTTAEHSRPWDPDLVRLRGADVGEERARLPPGGGRAGRVPGVAEQPAEHGERARLPDALAGGAVE